MTAGLAPSQLLPWTNEVFLGRVIAGHVVHGARVCPVDERILLETPFFSLRRFSFERWTAAPKLLVVVPLSGIRALVLYDMLSGLLPEFDLHALFWADPVNIPAVEGPFGLDDNIAAVLAALRCLGPGTHVAGLCQSALPALAATALLAAEEGGLHPASLMLLGGKIDTRISPARVDILMRRYSREEFMRQVIALVPAFQPGHGRMVYPAHLQEMMMLAYVGRHMLNGGEIFRKMLHDDGGDLEEHPFVRLLLSAVDIPGEFFLDTQAVVFQENALAEGRLTWRGRAVEPVAITRTALLTIEAAEDDIAGSGQTRAAHGLCRALPEALHAHHVQEGIGHFGLFHGAVWRGAILPRLCAFTADHPGG
ncbi:esterase [Acidocella aquatica]|uniref:Esterase n=1 Tax=Acidocella aquatica TaxID=1922313 RepID=A0ABQ6ACU6_9PROT|nr:polyhydroxyalkanoate depolymerase [Acidocella aquatica]GLR67880.1 esterase [Acidocella aquatica]